MKDTRTKSIIVSLYILVLMTIIDIEFVNGFIQNGWTKPTDIVFPNYWRVMYEILLPLIILGAFIIVKDPRVIAYSLAFVWGGLLDFMWCWLQGFHCNYFIVFPMTDIELAFRFMMALILAIVFDIGYTIIKGEIIKYDRKM